MIVQKIKELSKLAWTLISSVDRKRVFLFAEPTHPNLGDQAQLMCTQRWISASFPECCCIKYGMLFTPYCDALSAYLFGTAVIKLLLLKLFVKKDDLFIGHSGYFFVDHHSGWFTYYTLVKRFNNRFIILPQTINFYAPVVKEMASLAFSEHRNITLLCRDEVSLKNAQQLFTGIKLLLFPDIVTSLIGTRMYHHIRDGILFCMRDDIEQYYTQSEIKGLMAKFGNVRMEVIDTTLNGIDTHKIRLHKEELIDSMIDKMSTYQVVVTDRYHGTIFAAIASTPVIVISSADHKLSSGVKWFPEEYYGGMIQFANNLEEAYMMARQCLEVQPTIENPPYFKNQYWDKLSDLLREELL